MSDRQPVCNESLVAFNDLKLRKKHKFIIYSLNSKLTKIVIEQTSSDQSYDKFLEYFPENECKYAVYDFEFEIGGGEGKRSKIVFFLWSPDTAPIRAKMLYASSKDGFIKALNGVAAEIQGTDFSEVAEEVILEKFSRGLRFN
ncbi:cofilin [Metschnikowia bicuspidata]|uniref:Cofilin n=1 Tax=Metschnikowia bicuspidata TaxID=27322 RepID=A0A4P9ZA33_9ASCO|nr:cofilin [Metschnikowia bicuspidata]